MMTDSPQPLWQHSSAARITLTLPMHSKEKSTPPSVISTITSWMGLSNVFGLMQSVAPSLRASSNLLSLMSMAMMRPALARRAPMMAERPMPPARRWRRSHLFHLGGVHHGADAGGDAAASRQTSSGAAGSTLAMEISGVPCIR